jgi:hypothetical protein
VAASHRDDGQLGVIAVSQDSGPQASVEAFLAKLKVEDLGAYHDPKMGFSGVLGPDLVLPTTILFDADGKEVWRYVGDLDWTSPAAAKLLSEAGAPTNISSRGRGSRGYGPALRSLANTGLTFHLRNPRGYHDLHRNSWRIVFQVCIRRLACLRSPYDVAGNVGIWF